jgi:hypothetical protein
MHVGHLIDARYVQDLIPYYKFFYMHPSTWSIDQSPPREALVQDDRAELARVEGVKHLVVRDRQAGQGRVCLAPRVRDLDANSLPLADGLPSHGEWCQDQRALTCETRPLDLLPRLAEPRVLEERGPALARRPPDHVLLKVKERWVNVRRLNLNPRWLHDDGLLSQEIAVLRHGAAIHA